MCVCVWGGGVVCLRMCGVSVCVCIHVYVYPSFVDGSLLHLLSPPSSRLSHMHASKHKHTWPLLCWSMAPLMTTSASPCSKKYIQSSGLGSAPCCSTVAPAGKHTPYMRPTTCTQTHRGKCVTQAQTHRPNHVCVRECVCVRVCVCECEANQRALLQHNGSSREAHTVHTEESVLHKQRHTGQIMCVCV